MNENFESQHPRNPRGEFTNKNTVEPSGVALKPSPEVNRGAHHPFRPILDPPHSYWHNNRDIIFVWGGGWADSHLYDRRTGFWYNAVEADEIAYEDRLERRDDGVPIDFDAPLSPDEIENTLGMMQPMNEDEVLVHAIDFGIEPRSVWEAAAYGAFGEDWRSHEKDEDFWIVTRDYAEQHYGQRTTHYLRD